MQDKKILPSLWLIIVLTLLCVVLLPEMAAADTLGMTTIGTRTDDHDSNTINGSRFVTGALPNNITSMSVYVRGIDAAPNNQFQMAIYADSNGSPSALVASTTQGILTANAWNSLPIAASLTPNTPYWLVYNTNGTNPNVNNMAYSTGGTSTWINSGVAFGTWPANFGASTKASVTFSIFATNTAGPPADPTVSLTAPADGASVSGTQAVTANASNAVGVQFKLDGANLGAEDTTSPYSVSWDTTTVANGSHSLSAVARNNVGATATSSSVSVNVNNVAPPPFTPNQPILLITDPANPYTSYYTEILSSEGIKSYNSRELNQVDSALLNQYDVVVLGEMLLSDPQVTMLANWVNAGGKLIAMRPDKKLASLLGLTDIAATLSNAYLKVDTVSGPGKGIVGETIQYHSTADRYNLNGASVIATLYSDATTATANPAVTLHSVGASGGQAAAFSYDLARSIVQTRQGNAAWAGQQRDGVSGYEASEMFFGVGGEPNWNNLDKAIIPIADEQQRLFANMILDMEKTNNPLPRLWYLPRSLKAAVVMTGDDHGHGGTAGRFNIYLSQSPAGCNVANWECVRSSSYIYNSGTIMSNSQALSFNNQGFEIGLHVTTNCGPYGSPSTLASIYSSQLSTWRGLFPDLPSPSSSRTHCVEWDDWATQAKTKLANGMGLDTDYYYYPTSFVNGRPGYFNGAGMPMRFADLDGSIIDVYQATTQITDESGLDVANAINTLLDKAIGPDGYYAVITANMHTDLVASPGSDAIVAAAQARGIPVVSGRQMLQWLDARNASGLDAINWGNAMLSFEVTGGATGLTGMIPMVSPAGILSTISRGGSPVAFSTQVVKGIYYAFFTAIPGTYTVNYAPDTTPPTIVSSKPLQGETDVSTLTTITFTASEALDPATVTSANVELRDGLGTLLPVAVRYNSATNSVVLTPSSALQVSTSYTATASTGLKDLAGNALVADYQVSFTTAAQPTVALIGNNQIGSLTDDHDSNTINGSRFVNGALQNNITSMSVYVRGIDAAPNNQFQMAIYADSNGSPSTLVASTAQGTLTANAWNTLPITASLAPNTPYWLVYNTNGRTSAVNNMAYSAGGTSAWANSGVAFGTWPANFGASTKVSAKFSIYAQ